MPSFSFSPFFGFPAPEIDLSELENKPDVKVTKDSPGVTQYEFPGGFAYSIDFNEFVADGDHDAADKHEHKHGEKPADKSNRNDHDAADKHEHKHGKKPADKSNQNGAKQNNEAKTEDAKSENAGSKKNDAALKPENAKPNDENASHNQDQASANPEDKKNPTANKDSDPVNNSENKPDIA